MTLSAPLQVEAFERQLQENQALHHLGALRDQTEERLCVRRGQAFRLLVKFRERVFCAQHDTVTLQLQIGPSPSERDGTVVRLSSAGHGELSVKTSGEDRWAVVEASTPACAPVGRYQAFLETGLVKDGASVHCSSLGEIVVLFNAWCEGDAVYLTDEVMRSEYVLSESGQIYMGSQDYIIAIPWNFSQFAHGLGDICFKILDMSSQALANLAADTSKRGDPVYISRVVSAMINCNDDKGVLHGNWSGSYQDGTCPTSWTGSADILRRWYQMSCQQVKYGQCWVFAAVACTVLRFLGLPSRVVTNFSSAHDTDGNLRCDRFYDAGIGAQQSRPRDAVWNFHVWVEVWMSRKDIAEGYDGWQVIDPTPQEKSDGVFCCGPAPVRAVRRGHVSVGHDTPFVFAEVNADIVMWSVAADGSRKIMSCGTDTVGRNISTKRAGRNEREDITLQYKYQEGTQEERAAYARARSSIRGEQRDPKVTLRPPPRTGAAGQSQQDQLVAKGLLLRTRLSGVAFVGGDLSVYTVVRNPSHGHAAAVQLTLCARAVTYTGAVGGVCARKVCSVVVEPGEDATQSLCIKYTDYESHLTEQSVIRVTCAVTLPGQETVLAFAERNVILEAPHIDVTVLGEPVVGKTVEVTMSLENPLPRSLKGGLFAIEGPNLTRLQEVACSPEVAPRARACASASICPSQPGLCDLVVSFSSDRLRNARGLKRVVVRRA